MYVITVCYMPLVEDFHGQLRSYGSQKCLILHISGSHMTKQAYTFVIFREMRFRGKTDPIKFVLDGDSMSKFQQPMNFNVDGT